MKVSILQTDIRWADITSNIEHVEGLLLSHAGSDLYVLPEMWSTGFATEPEGIAEPVDYSRALKWMQQMAGQLDAAIVGSLALQTPEDTYCNRLCFATTDGMTFYDKHHLFTYGHENDFYTAGGQRVVVSFRGWRFRLLTCYDLRFPVWCRYPPDAPYDVIIAVANWPQSRQLAWEILTRARAVENQAYLIGVNRVGDDNYSHYQGNSCVVSPLGQYEVLCDADVEQVVTTILDQERLQSMRQRFRVLDDSDTFTFLPATHR